MPGTVPHALSPARTLSQGNRSASWPPFAWILFFGMPVIGKVEIVREAEYSKNYGMVFYPA